jgi:hypothetical protein
MFLEVVQLFKIHCCRKVADENARTHGIAHTPVPKVYKAPFCQHDQTHANTAMVDK